MKTTRKLTEDRLTVSLAPGQRETLEAIALANGVKLAFLARRAIAEFIGQHEDKQLRLFDERVNRE